MPISSCQENFVDGEEDEVMGEGEEDYINVEDDETGCKRKAKTRATGSTSQVEMKTRSPVWAHFTRLPDNRNRCKCNYCCQGLKCATTSGTSNLAKHLTTCKSYIAWKQRSTQQNLNSGSGVSTGNMQVGRVTEAVFREACNEMLVLGELPLAFIESIAWRHFCRRVQLYQPHSRRTATRDIVLMYVSQKDALKKMLVAQKQRVSLTTDIWVAQSTGASYMVITCHFVDSCWRLRKLIIGFKHVLDHKGATIADVLLDCLAEWGIERVFTITVDNATANTNALKIFVEKFQEISPHALILSGCMMHVRCCAHILNLIVKDGFSEMSKSVAAVRNAVVYVRASGNRLESFEHKLDSERITRGSLTLDVRTRWNSTFLMLTRALKFRHGFDKMEAEDKLYSDHFLEMDNGQMRVGPPLKADWDKVDGLIDILTVFYQSTLVVSASTTVCSHKVYSEICDIDNHLTTVSKSADLDLSVKAEAMRGKFDKYWDGLDNINRLLIIASVFDPRNKMKFANLCFETLYGKGSLQSKWLGESVSDVMVKLFEEYNTNRSNPPGFASSASQGGTTAGGHRPAYHVADVEVKVGTEGMASVYNKLVNEEGYDETKTELDIYLKESVENPKSSLLGTEYDVLSWWRFNSTRFPVLSELARDILAMQVSSVASESAFSTSGQILVPQRSCLTHYMIEVLMCTEQWMKADHHIGEKGVENFAQMVADIEEQDQLEKEFQFASEEQGN